jgi:hypothetical protein
VALHAFSDGDTSTTPNMERSTLQSRAHQVLEEGLAGWQDCYPDVTIRRIVVYNDPARQLSENRARHNCSSLAATAAADAPA